MKAGYLPAFLLSENSSRFPTGASCLNHNIAADLKPSVADVRRPFPLVSFKRSYYGKLDAKVSVIAVTK